MTRAFCLLTTGRSGSTDLMNAIAEPDSVRTPRDDMGRNDHELLNPGNEQAALAHYGELLGQILNSGEQLMEAFLNYHREQGTGFAGFKCMPNRHRDWDGFTAREDIQFITLVRKDIASTAASFHLARSVGTWRRSGGEQPYKWQFTEREAPLVMDNLKYLYRAWLRLDRVPSAIRLVYEDLCSADFVSPELDEYFSRPIRLPEPKPPTDASTYVVNWPEFKQFVEHVWQVIDQKVRENLSQANNPIP